MEQILWTGRAYYSLEHCQLYGTAGGMRVESVIAGIYEGNIYRVDYRLHTNPQWETQYLELQSRYGDRWENIVLKSDTRDSRTLNGQPAPQFDGCLDVDIPLTPFTNTLPIRRLDLREGEEQLISIIYLDLIAGEIRPVQQKYRRISEYVYHYENVPNDFEADIQVNAEGLVVDYPGLFVRKVP
ncbi:MAG: putative glycolipid-binding domain-containing protein [Bacteroidia bacterium]|nr:putative glycolipid-binding domain-containing protein [Bacteroidia bacterium]